MKNPSLLVLGEAVVPTGYARVSQSIFSRLAHRYAITQLATRYEGGSHDLPWELIRATDNGDPYGLQRLGEVVRGVDPDLIFCVYDLPMLMAYIRHLDELNHRAKVVFYVPVESGPINPRIVAELGKVDRVVAYTEFGRTALLDAAKLVPTALRVDVLPHGVDLDVFRPLAPDRATARRLGRAKVGLADDPWREAFIVLNANRNMQRKRIDLTLCGFASFALERPNAYLYLHMGMIERGWHIEALAKRYGVLDRIIMTTDSPSHPDVSQEYLNAVYNACDVGITTTSGEGWGLVAFEHAAVGAPQILPRHTALAELWNGAADLLEPLIALSWPGTLEDQFIIDPENLAEALTRLYEDHAHLDLRAKQARANVEDPRFRWDSIAALWGELLDSVLVEES